MVEPKELIEVSQSCIDRANRFSPHYWAIAIALVECGYTNPCVSIRYIDVTNPNTGKSFRFQNDKSLIKWQRRILSSREPLKLETVPISIHLDHKLEIARISNGDIRPKLFKANNVKLGTHSAEMELSILNYADTEHEFGFEDLNNVFTINSKTGKPFCSIDEKFNHITDWRLASAVDDLLRYGLIVGNEKSSYSITDAGKNFLDKIKRI